MAQKPQHSVVEPRDGASAGSAVQPGRERCGDRGGHWGRRRALAECLDPSHATRRGRAGGGGGGWHGLRQFLKNLRLFLRTMRAKSDLFIESRGTRVPDHRTRPGTPLCAPHEGWQWGSPCVLHATQRPFHGQLRTGWPAGRAAVGNAAGIARASGRLFFSSSSSCGLLLNGRDDAGRGRGSRSPRRESDFQLSTTLPTTNS